MKKLLKIFVPMLLAVCMLFSMSITIQAKETNEFPAFSTVMSFKPNEEKLLGIFSAINGADAASDQMKSMLQPVFNIIKRLQLKQNFSKNGDVIIQSFELGTADAAILDIYSEINAKDKLINLTSSLIKNKYLKLTEQDIAAALKDMPNGAQAQAALSNMFDSLGKASFKFSSYEAMAPYQQAIKNAFEKTLKAKLKLEEGSFSFDSLEKLTKKYSGEIVAEDIKAFMMALSEEKGFEQLKASLDNLIEKGMNGNGSTLVVEVYTDGNNIGIMAIDKQETASFSLSCAPNEKKLGFNIVVKNTTSPARISFKLTDNNFNFDVESNGAKLSLVGKGEMTQKPFNQKMNIDVMLNDPEPLFTLMIESKEIEKLTPMDYSKMEALDIEKLKNIKDPTELVGNPEDFQNELVARLQNALKDDFQIIQQLISSFMMMAKPN